MANSPENSSQTNMPKDLAVPMSQAINIWGNIFTVLAGEEKKPLVVHEAVLGSSSAFFQKAMKSDWAESRADVKTIDMSHCHKEVLSAYIHWLYFKNIPLDKIEGPLGVDFTLLAQAFVLGEELMDVKFKNTIVDTFLSLELKHSALPNATSLNIIYDGTPPSSPMRCLMLDFYAYGISDDVSWNVVLEACSKDVLVDIITTMSKFRARAATEARPWRLSNLKYHEKEDESF